jgi:hypothetical protein
VLLRWRPGRRGYRVNGLTQVIPRGPGPDVHPRSQYLVAVQLVGAEHFDGSLRQTYNCSTD